jgi:hypothetical protein
MTPSRSIQSRCRKQNHFWKFFFCCNTAFFAFIKTNFIFESTRIPRFFLPRFEISRKKKIFVGFRTWALPQKSFQIKRLFSGFGPVLNVNVTFEWVLYRYQFHRNIFQDFVKLLLYHGTNFEFLKVFIYLTSTIRRLFYKEVSYGD